MPFKKLKLDNNILKAVSQSGYTTPTPIQEKAIPAVLEGHDLLAAAQTGTGKTAGFTLPLLQLCSQKTRVPGKHVRALILTPTRELAMQIKKSIEVYGKHLNVTSAVVIGGVNIKGQIKQLKKGVDFLVATPGRLLDLYHQNAVIFKQVEFFVLDEADRMLDMGFLPDITKIAKCVPSKRQTLLFSATFNPEIKKLAQQFLKEPVTIDVSPKNIAADSVHQEFFLIDKNQKCDLLQHLFKKENWYQALVFTRTKHGADKVARKLHKAGFKALAIHGNKSQNSRLKALNDFKKNKIEFLVATDIAARGLDIKELPHVVNFDLPGQSEDYVHRIGRTGRAGEKGHAVSFVSRDDGKSFRSIERYLKKEFAPQAHAEFQASFDLKDLSFKKTGTRTASKPTRSRRRTAGRRRKKTGRKPRK